MLCSHWNTVPDIQVWLYCYVFSVAIQTVATLFYLHFKMFRYFVCVFFFFWQLVLYTQHNSDRAQYTSYYRLSIYIRIYIIYSTHIRLLDVVRRRRSRRHHHLCLFRLTLPAPSIVSDSISCCKRRRHTHTKHIRRSKVPWDICKETCNFTENEFYFKKK